MEGGPRRNSSSDMTNAVQVCILAIRMILQEAPIIGTCFMNIQEGRKPKNIWGKAAITALKCTAATFLAAFMWRRPLNSAVLATTTHRKPNRVSDGTCTQVRAQMINKHRIKMVQRELYNVRDPPWENDRKFHERKHCSNLNCICT